MCTPSKLICHVKLPLFLNFQLIQPIVEAKTYMQHFDNFMQQICSIMLQNLFLFAEHSFYIDLLCKITPIPNFLPWYNLLQRQKPVCSILTTLCSKYAALCCNFFFWMSTPFSLIFYVKLPLFPNFQLNTTYCRGKSLYAVFW